MIFSSTFFLFFFLPIVLGSYYLILKKIEPRNYFLLASSLFFYAWGEPYYILLMLGSILVNYILGGMISSCPQGKLRRCILGCGVMVNIAPFALLKYEGFFVEIVQSLPFFSSLSLESAGYKLPIGISFFTFQAISYLVDVFRKVAPAQKNIFHLGLYISLFPQLVAGPIVRYHSIAEQIQERTTTKEQFHKGIKRFILGFSKKAMIADQLAGICDLAFSTQELSFTFAWLSTILFALLVYYDFSGYSDMAIGLGNMFGFEFEENFDYPYMSKSVSEFWQRFHISLGTWFRDYVYIPLGGSRVKGPRLVWNLFLVWLLTGIWHGAAWQFIAWGMLNFVILSFEKWGGFPRRFSNQYAIFAYRIVTFICIFIGYAIFGAKNLTAAQHHLSAMFPFFSTVSFTCSFTIRYLAEQWFLYLIAMVCATPLLKNCERRLEKMMVQKMGQELGNKRMEALMAVVLMGLFLVGISFLIMEGNNPFVYFDF